jgi:dihydrofolate reductase
MFVWLEGAFEAPDQQFDWHVRDSEFDISVSKMLGSIDGILLGRRTCEGFAAYWPTWTDREAEAMNRLPKIGFSRTLNTVDWSNSRLVKENAAAEVAKLNSSRGRTWPFLPART